MSSRQSNIKVVVRVRPFNCKEKNENVSSIIKVVDETSLLFDPDEDDDEFFFQGVKQNYRDITKRVKKKLNMDFDRVFGTDASNMHIFEESTAPLVDSVLKGYNCSVFVYGATGAGKTFTMLGSKSCPGLTILTMRHLFEKIAAQQQTRKFDVGISYLEVYNEQVINLLTNRNPLKLREDSNGVVVSGLTLKPIRNAEELLDLLARGNSNRTQHPTDANAESSRSHAVFQVHIRMTEQKTGIKRLVKLSMIDLAGSERAASTKAMGVRFKEGANINKSLLALGNCINKLADGNKHIPYRDSNLTRLLKDSLGGNCQTLMVANVSMSSLTYEDTYNTLKYASRAKKIRTTLKQNSLKSNMPKEFYIKKVSELVEENEKLKQQLNVAVEKEKSSELSDFDDNELKRWYSQIDMTFSSIFEAQKQLSHVMSALDIETIRNEFLDDTQHNKKQKSNFYTPGFLNTQSDKLKKDLTSHILSYKNACKKLKLLEIEIKTTKYFNILQFFFNVKYTQLRNLGESLVSGHKIELQSELINEYNSIVKDVYLSGNQKQKIEKLKNHLIGDPFKTRFMMQLNYDELAEASKPESDHNVDDEPHKKRFRLNDTFSCNLDKTHVLSSICESSRNHIDSHIDSAPSCTLLRDKNSKDYNEYLVNSILSRDIVKSSGRPDKLKDVLIKSRKFTQNALKKTLATSAKKENLTLHSNRIRKSPRLDVVKGQKSSTTVIAKHRLFREAPANEYSKATPSVRINRAASLRVKK